MNERISLSPRHVRIDLSNDDFRHLGCRPCDIDGHAQCAESVFVRRRHVQQSDIKRQHVFAKKIWHLGEENRNIVGMAFDKGLTDVRTDKERVDVKAVANLSPSIWSVPFSVQMNDLNISQLRSPRRHRSNKSLRSSGDAVNEDPIA